MEFPPELLGSVWHTTSLERYAMIVDDGCIKANPNIADTERWGTQLGEKYFPFVRSLGGVSVFDFRNFDIDSTDWATFVPCQTNSQSAVWIEIDISKLGDNFKSARSIRDLWHQMGSTRKFITRIEGAVLGEIPTSAFKKILYYERQRRAFFTLV
ncbi:hypothetical protein [Vibrio harveyi]|uniref:hypothetical protein n=1 Tax=Vibrio harveyi TaxID=669 RepID=UPI0004A4F674|nr:hypothetical protein [Vibrio harveyi]